MQRYIFSLFSPFSSLIKYKQVFVWNLQTSGDPPHGPGEQFNVVLRTGRLRVSNQPRDRNDAASVVPNSPILGAGAGTEYVRSLNE